MTSYNELYHYGVKGMHWGVRRYQNYDGTYNSAGKKRYFGEGKKDTKSNLKSVARGLAIAGGVVVSAAALRVGVSSGKLGVRKIITNVGHKALVDFTSAEKRSIEAGQKVSHLFWSKHDDIKNAEFKSFERMYATTNKLDDKRYEALLRSPKQMRLDAKDFKSRKTLIKQLSDSKGVNKYVSEYEAKRALNGPSHRTANEIHKQLIADEGILSSMSENNKKLIGRGKTENDKAKNLAVALQREVAQNPTGKAAKSYYKAFKDAGYDYVTDYIDAGSLGKEPAIILNNDALVSTGIRRVKRKEHLMNLLTVA